MRSRRSRRVALVAMLVLAGVVLAALVHVPVPQGAVEVVAVDNEWGPVSEETTVVRTHLTLRNAYPVPLTVSSAQFALVANGVHLANGTLEKGAVLPADSESALTVETRVDTQRFLAEWWPSHVHADERTRFEVRGTAVAEAGRIALDVPFHESRSWRTHVLADLDDALRSCPSSGLEPCVAATEHAWGSTTAEGTRLDSVLTIHNPAPLPVPVTRTPLELRLAGVPVSESRADELTLLPAKGTTDVTVTSVIAHDALARWWPRHVDACEESPAAVRVHVVQGVLAVEAPLDTVRTDFACG